MQPDNGGGGGSENCAHVWANNCLNDITCPSTAASGLPLAMCCEVPALPAPGTPCTSCPAGFSNVDASGFCYKGITGSYTWDAANTACRALGPSSSLAVAYDATTGASIVPNHCAGLVTTSSFYFGLRDNEPGVAGHANGAGSYWRWMGSGSVNTWFITSGTGYWGAGERE